MAGPGGYRRLMKYLGEGPDGLPVFIGTKCETMRRRPAGTISTPCCPGRRLPATLNVRVEHLDGTCHPFTPDVQQYTIGYGNGVWLGYGPPPPGGVFGATGLHLQCLGTGTPDDPYRWAVALLTDNLPTACAPPFIQFTGATFGPPPPCGDPFCLTFVGEIRATDPVDPPNPCDTTTCPPGSVGHYRVTIWEDGADPDACPVGPGSGSGSGSGPGAGLVPVLGHRRMMKYAFHWPAYWTGGGSGVGTYVPSLPVFVGAECLIGDVRLAGPCYPAGMTVPRRLNVLPLKPDWPEFPDSCYAAFCGNPSGQPVPALYDPDATANSLALFGTQYHAVWRGQLNPVTPVYVGLNCYLQPDGLDPPFPPGSMIANWSVFSNVYSLPIGSGSGSGSPPEGYCPFAAGAQYQMADASGNPTRANRPISWSGLSSFGGQPGECCPTAIGIPPVTGRVFVYEDGGLFWGEDPPDPATACRRYPTGPSGSGSGSGARPGDGLFGPRGLMKWVGVKGGLATFVGACCPRPSGSGSGSGSGGNPCCPGVTVPDTLVGTWAGPGPTVCHLHGHTVTLTKDAAGNWVGSHEVPNGVHWTVTLACSGSPAAWSATVTSTADTCGFSLAQTALTCDPFDLTLEGQIPFDCTLAECAGDVMTLRVTE